MWCHLFGMHTTNSSHVSNSESEITKDGVDLVPYSLLTTEQFKLYIFSLNYQTTQQITTVVVIISSIFVFFLLLIRPRAFIVNKIGNIVVNYCSVAQHRNLIQA